MNFQFRGVRRQGARREERPAGGQAAQSEAVGCVGPAPVGHGCRVAAGRCTVLARKAELAPPSAWPQWASSSPAGDQINASRPRGLAGLGMSGVRAQRAKALGTLRSERLGGTWMGPGCPWRGDRCSAAEPGFWRTGVTGAGEARVSLVSNRSTREVALNSRHVPGFEVVGRLKLHFCLLRNGAMAVKLETIPMVSALGKHSAI